MEVGMLCTINRETFHALTKNTWIGILGASCHITYDDAGLYNIAEINELVQRSLGNMSDAKWQASHESTTS